MAEPIESSDGPTAADLGYSLEDARLIWKEAARVSGLHRQLAFLYRTKSRDRRTIEVLWERIEEGESELRAMGVHL